MKASRSKRDTKREKINQAILVYLEHLSKQELVERLYQFAQCYDDVWEQLSSQCHFQPEADSVQELVAWTKQAIKEATKPGLEWGGDYQTVQNHLQQLLDKGQANTVLRLGLELFKCGSLQMESSDEHLMDDDIVLCLEVVFAALKKSSLSPYEQMCWVWDLEQKDSWQLCSPSAATFWDQHFPNEAWSQFADHLQSRLEPLPQKKRGSTFAIDYRRNQSIEKIRISLEKANRKAEVLQLFIQEAKWTGDFLPVVDLLLSSQHTNEAEEWIRRGIQEAIKQGKVRETVPLIHRLQKLREVEQDWTGVAALEAEAFFLNPDGSNYEKLKQASLRVGFWEAVRANVLVWLASTNALEIIPGQPVGEELPPWPLPSTGNSLRYFSHRSPQYDVLIAIAILENQPEEVLRWYDAKPKSQTGLGNYVDTRFENRIAEAVVTTHPDRAIALWLRIAESFTDVSRHQYSSAVNYLAKIRRILEESQRKTEWEEILSKFLQTYSSQSRLKRLIKEMAQNPLAPQ